MKNKTYEKVKKEFKMELQNLKKSILTRYEIGILNHEEDSLDKLSEVIDDYEDILMGRLQMSLCMIDEQFDAEIPKKPVIIKDNGWNNGYNCVCPKCSRPLDTEDGRPNFCSYCGQKIDWVLKGSKM